MENELCSDWFLRTLVKIKFYRNISIDFNRFFVKALFHQIGISERIIIPLIKLMISDSLSYNPVFWCFLYPYVRNVIR